MINIIKRIGYIMVMLCFILNISMPFVYAEDITVTINETNVISDTVDIEGSENEYNESETQELETDVSEEIADQSADTEAPVISEEPSAPALTDEPTEEPAPQSTEALEIELNINDDIADSSEYVIVMYEDESGQRINDHEVESINGNIDVVKLDPGTDVYQYIEDIKAANDNIKHIQPDYELDLAAVDENWSFETESEKNASLVNADEYVSGINTYSYDENIKIDSDLSEAMGASDGAGVKVGILDTEQTDGQENIYDSWHGSMIRNIISYIAPETEILSYNLFQDGKGYVSDAIRAIIDCSDKGAAIVNCSWTVDEESPVLEDVIRASGMLFVCAAGNDRKNLDVNPVYPAAYKSDNVITVGAANSNGMLCSYSNYSQRLIDITAQGDKITSISSDGSEYRSSGTSFSAAFVTAAGAMVKSSDNALGTADLKSRIVNGAVRLSTLYDQVNSGRFLNAKNAVEGTSVNEVIVLKTGRSEAEAENIAEQVQLYSDNGDDQWSKVGTVNTSRYNFATETYGGKIYVLGGIDNNTGSSLDKVEAYDTEAGTWNELSPMPHSRSHPKSVLVADKIYVFSGSSSDKAIDVYDINTDTWSTPMEFPYNNDGYAVGVRDNGDNEPPASIELFVLGGSNTRDVYKYRFAEGAWSQTSSMLLNLTDARIVYAQYDRNETGFYLVDGDCNGRAIAYCENSQYIDDTVAELSGFTLAASPDLTNEPLNDDFRIFITGGANIYGNDPVQSCSALYYNEAIYGDQVSWLGMQQLPEAMSYHGSEIVDGYLYVFGGKTSSSIYRISSSAAIDDEGYNISDGEWARGSINNISDVDYFSFTPNKTGWYTIDTGDSRFYGEFYMNGVYDGGDSEKGFCKYLTAGETYPFYIKFAHESEFCKRYELRFVYRNINGMKNLTVGYEKTISCNNTYPEVWFKIVSGSKINITSSQPVTVEKFIGDSSGKMSYESGTNTITLQNGAGGYLCITPTDGEWTGDITVQVESENTELFENSNMLQKRNKFEAVYMNGYIYAIGGYNESGVLTSAEKYDTQSEEASWQYISEIPKGALGFAAANTYDKIYVAGGYSGGQSISDLQIYNTNSNTWESGAAMPEPRERSAAVTCNGKLYVIGGRNDDGYCTSVLVYDIASNTWSEIDGFAAELVEPNAVSVNGAIYVAGGFDSKGEWNGAAYKLVIADSSVRTISVKAVPEFTEHTDIFVNGDSVCMPQIKDEQLYIYEYNTTLKKWSTTECGAVSSLGYYEAVKAGNEFYLLGGYDDDYSSTVYKRFLSSFESTEWDFHSNLSQTLNKTEPLLINGEKYIVGGFSGSSVKSIYKYNEADAAWQLVTNIPANKNGAAVECYGDCIYIIGGYGNTVNGSAKEFLNTVDIYNISTNQWTSGAEMPTAIERMGSALMGDSIYIFGGRNKNGSVSEVNIYNIRNDAWSSGGYMPAALINMAVGTYGHNIILAGGYNSEGNRINKYYIYDVETNRFVSQGESSLINGDISKVRGTNNLMFSCKNFTEENVSFIMYDPETDSWTNSDLNTNLPDFDYVSYMADENNVYYIGGYSVEGAENSDIVLSIEYHVPIVGIDYIETPPEISGEQTISTSSGNTYIVSITVTNMENLNDKIFTLDYDSSKLAIDDVCAQTWGKDISVGSVQDTDIEIISVTDSQIKFKTNNTQSPISGTVNMLRFNAIANGTTSVTVIVSEE